MTRSTFNEETGRLELTQDSVSDDYQADYSNYLETTDLATLPGGFGAFREGQTFPPRSLEHQYRAFQYRRQLFRRGYFEREVDPAPVRTPWYELASSFWRDALYASPPVVSSEDATLQQRVDKSVVSK